MTPLEAENLIQSLLQKLLAQYQPQKVILYGSYAYGNPHPNSDIDLLIIKDTSERFIDRWTAVQQIYQRAGSLTAFTICNRFSMMRSLMTLHWNLSRRLSKDHRFLFH